MLELKNIRRQFANGEDTVVALNNVSLRIAENEFVAIMGSSGSGKSTLMNVMGCLDTPNEGQYLLNNQDIAQLDDDNLSRIRNQKIGFIFQTFHLLPRLTALENILLPLRFSNEALEPAMQRALHLIERVGISHRKDHKPFEMSGGQRQRVAIARALINQPSVILADEPTGNLDSKTSMEIMALLSELHTAGQTIVMVTHEDEIADKAQRTIIMKDGSVAVSYTHLTLPTIYSV